MRFGLRIAGGVLLACGGVHAGTAWDAARRPIGRGSEGPPPSAAPQTTSPSESLPYRVVLSDFRDPPRRDEPGTLRWAIETLKGPRIITFAAPGVFNAKWDRLVIKDPYVTLDGGSAGVTLNGCELSVYRTHHVTLRNLRVREGAGKTQAQIDAGAKGGGLRSILVLDSTDVLVEHCSVEDSSDDNGCTWNYYGPKTCARVKWRYCIFAGGRLFKVTDADGTRDRPTKAMLNGAGAERSLPPAPPADAPDWLTIEHCLFMDTWHRKPDIAGRVFAFYNNVVIQEQWGCSQFTRAEGDIVNNWYEYRQVEMPVTQLPVAVREPVSGGLYVAGNLLDGKACNPTCLPNRGKTPLPAVAFRATPWHSFDAEPAASARQNVLQKAGCRPLDERDAELIQRASGK